MQYTRLGATGLTVSRLCLGTMTFGLQASEAMARSILDRARRAASHSWIAPMFIHSEGI